MALLKYRDGIEQVNEHLLRKKLIDAGVPASAFSSPMIFSPWGIIEIFHSSLTGERKEKFELSVARIAQTQVARWYVEPPNRSDDTDIGIDVGIGICRRLAKAGRDVVIGKKKLIGSHPVSTPLQIIEFVDGEYVVLFQWFPHGWEPHVPLVAR